MVPRRLLGVPLVPLHGGCGRRYVLLLAVDRSSGILRIAETHGKLTVRASAGGSRLSEVFLFQWRFIQNSSGTWFSPCKKPAELNPATAVLVFFLAI